MFELLLLFGFLLFVLVPIIYLLYSWQSRHTACPFCGNKILKSDRICPHCSENLHKLDTPDRKVVTIGKAFREGAEIRSKSDDEIEKRFRNRKTGI